MMKLEKRSSGEAEETPLPQEESHSKKPVVVYIMILFIVAFLLMALSFLMHPRGETEGLGRLRRSVSSMQRMEDEDLIACLPKESVEVTAPAQRYEQLKEAVLNK